jgi:hypothetical protein
MHLHRQYERRCRSCGYVWTVSRAEASMHKPNLSDAMRETEGEGIVEGSGARSVGSTNFEETAIKK